MKYIFTILISLLSLAAGAQVKREMRGTWIATVANIDWPVNRGLDAATMKKDLVKILDNVVACNMNTVVFQVRPTADACYRSSFEPWSHWLTGEQGKDPGFDPLEFLIEECDKRGLAVHVWLNPYRVWLDKANVQKAIHSAHPYNSNNPWVVEYGKTLLLHPANADVREYVCRIVAEIVREYNIDAIHMDDYFYPYRIAGQNFPDDAAFKSDPRGFTDKEDWRRDNVDLIVKQISDTIKTIKPWVEFGISPFGVWRNASKDPEGSATNGGQTNYDDLYADILKWQREGWIDYVVPQLYWQIGFKAADYKVLAEWWNKHAYGVPMYIGHALYRIDPKSSIEAWRTPMEIVRQIKLNRTLGNIGGSMLYSAKFLAGDALRKALIQNVYTTRLLVPENPKITAIAPSAPTRPEIVPDGEYIEFTWTPSANNRRYIVYRVPKNTADISDPANIIAVTGETSVLLSKSSAGSLSGYDYYLTALSHTHKESAPVKFGQR